MATSTPVGGTRPTIRQATTVGQLPANLPVAALDWANGQIVATSGTSAHSTAFDSTNDRIVRVSTSAAIYYKVGPATPTAAAAAGNDYLGAGLSAFVYVPATYEIAALQDTAGGNVLMIPAVISN